MHWSRVMGRALAVAALVAAGLGLSSPAQAAIGPAFYYWLDNRPGSQLVGWPLSNTTRYALGMPTSTPGQTYPVFDLGTGAIVGTVDFNAASATTGLAVFTPSAAGSSLGNAGFTLSVFDSGGSRWYVGIERQSAGSKVTYVETQRDASGAEKVMQVLQYDGGPVGDDGGAADGPSGSGGAPVAPGTNDGGGGGGNGPAPEDTTDCERYECGAMAAAVD